MGPIKGGGSIVAAAQTGDGGLYAQFLSASISRRVLGASCSAIPLRSGQDSPKLEGPVADRKRLKLVRFLVSRPVEGEGKPLTRSPRKS